MEIPNLSTNTPLVKDATPNPTPYNNDMKREHESVDDFEHLEISPSKEKSNIISDSLLNLGTDKDLPAPSNNVCSQPNLLDQSNNFHPFSQHEDSSKDIISGLNEKSMFSSKSENLDEFSKHSSFEKPSSSVGFEVSKFLEAETSDFKKPATDDNSDYFSKFSMDNSDTVIPEVKDSTMKDSSPEIGDFKHDKIIEHDFLNEPSNATNQNDKLIDVTPGKSFEKSLTPEPSANENQIEQKEPKPDPFELMSEKHTSQPEPQVPSIPITPSKPDPIAKDVPVSTNIVSVPKTNSDSIKSTPDKSASSGKFSTKEEAPVKVPDSLPIKKPDVFSKTESDDSEIIKVDEVFRRIGLDSWFKPETLHPQVEALVYWRDPKKSGAVFGTILVALLSLTYYSFISVVAYFSLIILSGTISFKIYKSILQAVQKTSDGHPFKEILEMELTLPQEKVREVTDTAVAHFNAAVIELRRLFLVEDLVDSIKFAVLLWLLTRVGAWFNGMTLIIIAFIALFSVPKVYENNKAQVDANLAIVQSKLQEITTKVKAALPIGKKEADKDKEQ